VLVKHHNSNQWPEHVTLDDNDICFVLDKQA